MASKRSDTLNDYLNRIGQIPLLTASEEIILGGMIQEWMTHSDPVPRRAERAGRRARERMVAANLRLAVRFAARYKHLRDVDFDDLIQAANLGVLRAAEKFDPTRGYKFSTYAYWWIRQSVTRYIQRHGVQVSMCGTDAERLARLAPITSRLRLELDREPALHEVAAELGIQPEHLAALALCNHHCISLDAPVMEGGEPLVAALQAPDEGPAESQGLTAAVVAASLEKLPSVQRRIVSRAWGIGCEQMTIPQIARAEKMQRAQVTRILKLAAQVIKQPQDLPAAVQLSLPVPY